MTRVFKFSLSGILEERNSPRNFITLYILSICCVDYNSDTFVFVCLMYVTLKCYYHHPGPILVCVLLLSQHYIASHTVLTLLFYYCHGVFRKLESFCCLKFDHVFVFASDFFTNFNSNQTFKSQFKSHLVEITVHIADLIPTTGHKRHTRYKLHPCRSSNISTVTATREITRSHHNTPVCMHLI